ncbi:MAG: hypothetical protein V4479_04610 [Actinomycetota bacterium]
MAEIDDILSSSLKRAATPADPSGVAERVRERVDAGDSGTPATGYGFGSSWFTAWLPWIGVVVVAALVGAAAGLTGLFGLASPAAASAPTLSIDHSVSGLACPAGARLVALDPGQRVLALQRTKDSAWLAVRDPYDLTMTVWVPSASVRVDHAADTAGLPIGGCPAPSVSVTPEPTVDPVAPDAPSAPSKKPSVPGQPAPAPDTTAPTVATPVVTVANCQTTITTTASDDVGVTSVTISWTDHNTGSGSMTFSGGTWKLVLTNPAAGMHDGNTVFKVIAHDAAGNSSAPKSASGSLQCLI